MDFRFSQRACKRLEQSLEGAECVVEQGGKMPVFSEYPETLICIVI